MQPKKTGTRYTAILKTSDARDDGIEFSVRRQPGNGLAFVVCIVSLELGGGKTGRCQAGFPSHSPDEVVGVLFGLGQRQRDDDKQDRYCQRGDCNQKRRHVKPFADRAVLLELRLQSPAIVSIALLRAFRDGGPGCDPRGVVRRRGENRTVLGVRGGARGPPSAAEPPPRWLLDGTEAHDGLEGWVVEIASGPRGAVAVADVCFELPPCGAKHTGTRVTGEGPAGRVGEAFRVADGLAKTDFGAGVDDLRPEVGQTIGLQAPISNPKTRESKAGPGTQRVSPDTGMIECAGRCSNPRPTRCRTWTNDTVTM